MFFSELYKTYCNNKQGSILLFYLVYYVVHTVYEVFRIKNKTKINLCIEMFIFYFLFNLENEKNLKEPSDNEGFFFFFFLY